MKKWYETLGNTRAILILRHLLSIKESTFTDLRENVKGSLSTVNNIVIELDRLGLVNDVLLNTYPRTRMISLTEKGRKVAEKLLEIEKILNE